MYLIGILLWGAVATLIAWGFALLLTRRTTTRWWTKGLALLLLPVVFMAPLADEIVGKVQFDRLCEVAKEVTIHATHPVGEELYTSDGKLKTGTTLEERNRLSAIYESLVRWDHGGPYPEVIPATIPIRKYHHKIYDNTDGRLLAEFDQYGTSGGWLSRNFQAPFLVKPQCEPPLFAKDLLKFHILPFSRKRETK